MKSVSIPEKTYNDFMTGRIPTIFGVDNIEALGKKVKLGIVDIHLTTKGKATHRLIFMEGRLKKEEISPPVRTKINPITAQAFKGI